MKGLKILEVKFQSGSVPNTIFPVLVFDEEEMVLIDCGYPGFLPVIEAAAKAEGIDIGRLTKIIITHHDFDHMGALAAFKRAYPGIQLLSSAGEESYISGREKSLRLQQAEALYPALPEEQKEGARQFHAMLEAVEAAAVDVLLTDGEVLPCCGGIEIIATPGHMPGHISVYLRESKTLVAGDAMVVEQGELHIANPQYTLDMKQARKSLKKLLDYEIERIVCYHGGIFEAKIKEALQKISFK